MDVKDRLLTGLVVVGLAAIPFLAETVSINGG